MQLTAIFIMKGDSHYDFFSKFSMT